MIKLEQTQLDSIISAINTRSKISNTYNKTEVDAKIVNSVSSNSRVISQLSSSGYNCQSVVINGKMYTAAGAGNTNYGMGIGNTTTAQLSYGLDNFTNVAIPSSSPVIDSSTVAEIGFALLANGELYTWGYNVNGTLGLGHTSTVVIPTLSATNVTKIFWTATLGSYSVDNTRLFILKSDGFLYGAGYNGYGALGDGTTVDKSTWTKITAFAANTVAKVFNMGSTYGCTFVLKTDGTIWVAGYNGWGQCGMGSTVNYSVTFTNVTSLWAGTGITSVQDIKVTGGYGDHSGATGYSQSSSHMLITKLDGTTHIKACGYNGSGQLGIGNFTNVNAPTLVVNSGTLDFVDISANTGGIWLTMSGLTRTGDLYTWGQNNNGRIGNGTQNDSTVPYKALTGVAKLTLNGQNQHTYGQCLTIFVIKTDGTLWGCGYNGHGQCGIGHTNNTWSYTKLILDPSEVVVELGYFYSTASGQTYLCRTEKGNMYAWGYGGQHNIKYGPANHGMVPILLNLPDKN